LSSDEDFAARVAAQSAICRVPRRNARRAASLIARYRRRNYSLLALLARYVRDSRSIPRVRPALSHLKCKVRGRALSSRKDRRTNRKKKREKEREKEEQRNTEKKEERKDYRGARYPGEGNRARGDERWLYKTRLGGEEEGGGREARGVGGMQQSYLTV